MIVLLLAALIASTAYVCWLPDVVPLKHRNPPTTAYIELRERQAQAEDKALHKRMTWVPWDGISENLKHAVLIAEDDQFYRHNGVDWDGVRLALARDLQEKRFASGGSTITQQLARNLYLSPSKNPLRKIKETLIARRLERQLGKRRIFELYLNVVEWGKGIFGAEAAAQAYFGKHASELSPEESAAMAAVLPNPRRWNPAGNSRYVERNMQRILGRMAASGYLPESLPEDEAYAILASTEAPPGVPASSETAAIPLPSSATVAHQEAPNQ